MKSMFQQVTLSLATILTAHAAFAACSPGQMTIATRPIEVTRTEPDGTTIRTELKPGAEVHVIGVKNNFVQIYALRDTEQNMIRSVGVVESREGALACQVENHRQARVH